MAVLPMPEVDNRAVRGYIKARRGTGRGGAGTGGGTPEGSAEDASPGRVSEQES